MTGAGQGLWAERETTGKLGVKLEHKADRLEGVPAVNPLISEFGSVPGLRQIVGGALIVAVVMGVRRLPVRTAYVRFGPPRACLP